MACLPRDGHGQSSSMEDISQPHPKMKLFLYHNKLAREWTRFICSLHSLYKCIIATMWSKWSKHGLQMLLFGSQIQIFGIFLFFSRYLNSSNSFVRYLTTIIPLFSNPIPPSAQTPVDKLVKANNKLLCHSPGWGCIESVPSLERMQLLSIFPDCSFLCSMVFCVLHTWSWYDCH